MKKKYMKEFENELINHKYRKLPNNKYNNQSDKIYKYRNITILFEYDINKITIINNKLKLICKNLNISEKVDYANLISRIENPVNIYYDNY